MFCLGRARRCVNWFAEDLCIERTDYSAQFNGLLLNVLQNITVKLSAGIMSSSLKMFCPAFLK